MKIPEWLMILKISRIDLLVSVLELWKTNFPGGGSNPGLPCDMRGYLPLYYGGCIKYRNNACE